MKKILFSAFVLLSFAACKKEVPMIVKLPISSVTIEGRQSERVSPMGTVLTVSRDSVVNEDTDTIYNIKGTLWLKLDSAMIADKIEESLNFCFLSSKGKVSIESNESQMADSLMAFLRGEKGDSIEVVITAQMSRSLFMLIANAETAKLEGFSFHQDADEALINHLMKEVGNYGQKAEVFRRSNGEYNIGAIDPLLKMEKADKRLRALKSKMTIWQQIQYEAIKKKYLFEHTVTLF